MIPRNNLDITFATSDGFKHTGWHSGTRYHSNEKPHSEGNDIPHQVISWEYKEKRHNANTYSK
jgi:hypothetical protein